VTSDELQRSGSGGEVNGLSEMPIERLPAVDFSERDLTGGEQGLEQHGGGFGRRQHGLRLDASLVPHFRRVAGGKTLCPLLMPMSLSPTRPHSESQGNYLMRRCYQMV
jgi:hypothetical protein